LTVQELLAAGADANALTDSAKRTALHAAAQAGRDGNVQLLLDNGVDANAATTFGSTALLLAAQYGHAKVVKLLLAAGADVQYALRENKATALDFAASGGHEEVIDLLLLAGAKIVDRGAGCTALHTAAAKGHAAVACKLLAAGADVNALFGPLYTPLILAAERGHLEVVQVLIAHGADSQQALVDAARSAASKNHMATWAFFARKVQGMYPEALSQCVGGMDAVAATRAMAVGWMGEVDRHEKILEAARRERAEVEVARREVQQLITQTALMQKQLERSSSDR
jgi:ankyrin repeat protein